VWRHWSEDERWTARACAPSQTATGRPAAAAGAPPAGCRGRCAAASRRHFGDPPAATASCPDKGSESDCTCIFRTCRGGWGAPSLQGALGERSGTQWTASTRSKQPFGTQWDAQEKYFASSRRCSFSEQIFQIPGHGTKAGDARGQKQAAGTVSNARARRVGRQCVSCLLL